MFLDSLVMVIDFLSLSISHKNGTVLFKCCGLILKRKPNLCVPVYSHIFSLSLSVVSTVAYETSILGIAMVKNS